MIPKIIHQIWLGDKDLMPLNCMKTVKEIHYDWQYYLWTEENLKNIYNNEKFDLVNNSNNNYDNKYTNLSNIIRYEKLYNYGGVYIDADSICNKSFSNLLSNEFFAGYENEFKRPNLIANGIIGCVPKHPIVEMCIQNIKNINNNEIAHKPSFKTTGPKLLTKSINAYEINKITIYPSWYFFPIHYSGYRINKKIDPYKDSYTNQLWLSTRKKNLTLFKRLLNKLKSFVNR